MLKTKRFAIILLALAVMFAQVGNVAAAPQLQDGTTTTIVGTIDEITTELDENGETLVIVKLTNDQGTQVITLSAQEAADNLLFDMDTQQLLAEVDDSVELVVDPNDVVPAEEPTEEGDVHPIAWLLAEFFDEDASVVNDYHEEDGFGFGVVAQALWISRNITRTDEQPGDASLAADILQAKQDKDFLTFFTEHDEYFTDLEGDVPTNWGQFKKLLAEKKNNLGVIVSEQAESEDSVAPLTEQDQGNGRDNRQNPNKPDKVKKEKKNNRP